MAAEGSIFINGRNYDLTYGTNLPSGKRQLVRRMRPSQPTDPSRLGQAEWALGGKYGGYIGRSREQPDGILSTDYAENIDTMWDDLLTASPAPNNVTLTSDDPPTGTSAFYGTPKYGAAYYQGGTAIATAGNATHADMQSGYLFIGRGPFDTQLNSSFSVVNTAVLDSIIAGKADWQGYGWLGLGAGAALKKRVSVTSTVATYSDVTIGGSNVYAGALQRGNDRLWLVDPINNQARYTFDAFVTESNPFSIGDDGKELTGIGALGPYTTIGALDGLWGFTDSGKPVLVDDLTGEDSPNNGARFASLWGWLYAITDLGIIAWTPNVANPVGAEALQEFDGPIDGRPTAIWAWRKQLFVAYYTTAGHTYILRGVYGPETESTGMPRWYPFKYMASVECDLLYSTPRSFATNPRILAGRGTNITTYIMGRRGRDIADSNYSFSTETGSWYGTRMNRAQHLHKYLRLASIWTEQCDATKYWQLAFSSDEGSYFNVGAPITTNGHHILRPTAGGKPIADASFHTLKPRLTLTNDDSTSPPQIRGKLTIEYDERPDMVEEVNASLDLNPGDWERLRDLVNHVTESPVQISMPGNNEMRYGFVTAVGPRVDANPDAVESVEVGILLWELD